jgi:hypothetical protein
MPSSVLQVFGVGTALLAGFIFIRFSPYRQFVADRLRADRYSLLVVGWSLLFVLIGIGIDVWLDMTMAFGKTFMDVTKGLYKRGIPPPVLYACVVAAIGAGVDRLWVLWCMRNHASITEHKGLKLGTRVRNAAIAMHVRKSDDAALRTLYRANFWHKLLMVTMKSGKVYIGKSLHSIDPCEFKSSIRLYPVASGYRDPITKRVKIETPYDNLQNKLSAPVGDQSKVDYADPLRRDEAQLKVSAADTCTIDLEDIGVVLVWSEIEYFTIYDDNISRVFGLPAPDELPPQVAPADPTQGA